MFVAPVVQQHKNNVPDKKAVKKQSGSIKLVGRTSVINNENTQKTVMKNPKVFS